MPPGDRAEPPEVDFVLDGDADPGADENLPQAARRDWVPPRARRPLAALAVAAVAGLVIVRVAFGGSDGSPTAHGTPSATTPSTTTSSNTSPSAAGVATGPAPAESAPQLSFSPVSGPKIAIRHDKGTVILIPVTGAAVLPTPGPACAGTDVCRTSDAVPDAVLRALRARYSDVTVDSATSLLSGPSADRLRLRTRTVVAHTPSQTVIVVIRPMVATDSTQVGASASGAGSAVRVTVAAQSWTVTVTARNPRTIDPDTTTPSGLATDPRLLVAR